MTFFLPFFLLIAGMTLFPAVFSAIAGQAQIRFDLFWTLFQDGAFRISAQVSALYAFIATLSVFFCGTTLAYLLIRLRRFWRKAVALLLFVIWALPSFVSLPIFRALLLNTIENPIASEIQAFCSILAGRFWVDLPVVALIALALFEELPPSYEESMRLEGAGTVDRFFSLFFQIAQKSLVGYLCVSFLDLMRDVNVPMMITEGRPLSYAGFTPYGIAGATTTLGFFLKNNLLDFAATDSWTFLWSQNALVTVTLLAGFWFLNRMFKRPEKTFGIWLGLEIVWSFSLGSLLFLPAFFFRDWHRRGHLRACAIIALGASLILRQLSPFTVILCFYLLFRLFPFQRAFDRLLFFFNVALAVLWIAMSGVALGFLVWLSFSRYRYLPPFPGIADAFKGLSWNNYVYLFDSGFLVNLKNSLWLGLGSGLLGVLVFSMAAYAALKNSRYHTFAKGLIGLTLVMAGMNTFVPLVLTLDALGGLNRFLPIVLAILNQSAPIAFMTAYAAFRQTDPTYAELGQIDGASRWQLFWKIVFPLAFPTVAVLFLYIFIRGWSSFIAPLLLISSPEKYPVSLRLYDWAGNPGLHHTRWGLFAAGALLTVTMMAVCSIPLPSLWRKRWSSG